MSKTLKERKCAYRNENLQVFVFSQDFKLLDTCQTFIKVNIAEGYMLSNFPFLSSKKKLLLNLKSNGERFFEAEEINWEGKHLTVDIVAQKEKEQYVVFIEDLTEAYKFLPAAATISDVELRNEMAKMKSLQKLKNDHFAKITHDIKLPLTEIVGTIYLLNNYVDSEKGKEYLSALSNASKNLDTMLNDLVSFSKAESMRLKIDDRPFAIEQVIWSVIKSFEFKTSQQNVPIFFKIDADIPQYLNGDPTRLSQIIYNLLDNALKFTKKGAVDIKISQLNNDKTACRLLFEVSDTGIGIPNDKLNKIFETYAQVKKEDSLSGFGIGLSIVKQLIELQDGSIEAKSQLGKGTCFSFQLPFIISTELKTS